MSHRECREVMSVVYLMFLYFFGGFTGINLLYYLLWTNYWYLTVAYVWLVIYDNLYTPTGSPSRSEWFRRWPIWRWACEYFPIKVHIDSRYDTQKTYICGYHPHGVMPNGAILGLSSNGLNIDEKLPGITVVLCHLALIHWMPMLREGALLHGSMNVDRDTIRNLLSRPGRMILIVVGGTAESLECQQGKYRLILRRRKGFVREALITGSRLVPIFSFGENYILTVKNTPPGSLWRKVQDFLKLYTRATIPIIKGRSIWGIPIPVLPHKVPVNIVFGPPIDVTKNANPTKEEVDELHEIYIRELQRLFESNKERFEPHATLEII